VLSKPVNISIRSPASSASRAGVHLLSVLADEASPVKTRELASEGYRQALAAHQSVAPARGVDPAIAEAVERQERAMRELRRRAFPEAEAAPAPFEDARVQRRRQAAATEAAALRRARAERAARQDGTATVPVGGPAGAVQLGRTA
jgi:hypothetical protein